MVEQETKVLIEEHLNECDDCKKKLSEMNVPAENPIDTAKPLQNLKKQLRKKRLYAAALAALIVFVGVYTYFFRTMAVQLLPW
jgi:predicted anti-sigma-YlaC factor YlaD